MCNSTKPLQLKLHQMKNKQLWEHQSNFFSHLGVFYVSVYCFCPNVTKSQNALACLRTNNFQGLTISNSSTTDIPHPITCQQFDKMTM